MITYEDDEYDEEYEDAFANPASDVLLEIERDLIAVMGARELGEITENEYQIVKRYMEKYQTMLEG